VLAASALPLEVGGIERADIVHAAFQNGPRGGDVRRFAFRNDALGAENRELIGSGRSDSSADIFPHAFLPPIDMRAFADYTPGQPMDNRLPIGKQGATLPYDHRAPHR
jgi:hypothetical protein